MKLKKGLKIAVVVLIILVVILTLLFFFLKKVPKEDISYVVSFNSEGGSLVKDIIIKEKTKLEDIPEPTKDGYKFLGWYYQDSLFDFSQDITDNLELIAKWEEIVPEKEEIVISQNYYEVKVGDTITLEFTKLPQEIEVNNLIFTTSNSLVAKPSNDGTIKALSPGKATILIKTKDNKFFTTCEVKVESNIIEVTKVSIKGPSEVKVGETIKLEAIITPSNATNKEVYWASNKESIATISDDGTLTGIKAGEVIITLTTMGLKSSEAKIIVSN